MYGDFCRFIVSLKEIDNGWIGAVGFDGERMSAILEYEKEFFCETRKEAVLRLSDEIKQLTLAKLAGNDR